MNTIKWFVNFKKRLKAFLKSLLRREYFIYYFFLVFSIIIFVFAFFSAELTVEILSAKLINLSMGGGAVYLIKTFDFKGVKFTNEILKGNIAAALAYVGICALVGIVLGAG